MIRVVSGIVLAAAALAAILFLPALPLRMLVCAVAGLAAREYLKLVGSSQGYIGGVLIAAWIAATSVDGGLIVAALMILLSAALSVMFPSRSSQSAILGAFAFIYIGVPLGLLANVHGEFGWQATLLLIGAAVVSDTLQFYSGRLFGLRPLAPSISPKKTREGAIGGVLAATLFMGLAGTFVFPQHSRVALALLGGVLAVFGIIGDLFESRLKREANIKDSSSVIPGHGGVLDRIDALLFVIPVFFVYAERTT